MKALEAALAYFLAYDARDWDTLRGLLADPIHAELNGTGSDLSVEDYMSTLPGFRILGHDHLAVSVGGGGMHAMGCRTKRSSRRA